MLLQFTYKIFCSWNTIRLHSSKQWCPTVLFGSKAPSAISLYRLPGR